jgi:hypothetical protein
LQPACSSPRNDLPVGPPNVDAVVPPLSPVDAGTTSDLPIGPASGDDARMAPVDTAPPRPADAPVQDLGTPPMPPVGCRADQKDCGGRCVPQAGCCPYDECPFAHGKGACVDGSCKMIACDTDFADCGPAPGCETDITSDQHCGSCGTACGVGRACKAGMCACAGRQCGDTCVDAATDSQNCGSCGRVCASVCRSGECVCPTPNGSNLVRNAGFTNDIGSWKFDPPLQPTFSSQDASGCSSSGSARFIYPQPVDAQQPNISQCLPEVTPGVRYRFGAWFQLRGNDPDGDFQVALQWHDVAGCGYVTGVTPKAEFAHGRLALARDTWNLVTGEAVAPPGARSALIRLIINTLDSPLPLEGSVDMAFVTPAPGGY